MNTPGLDIIIGVLEKPVIIWQTVREMLMERSWVSRQLNSLFSNWKVEQKEMALIQTSANPSLWNHYMPAS